MSISIDGSGTITGATTMASTIASPTLTTPALGIPSSGTVTNLTGTASININGTVGATTPAAGAFTTGAFSNDVAITGTTRSLAFATPGWSGGVAAYLQAGVNTGGTGPGDNFMSNVPTGKSFTWAINNASKMLMDSSGNVGIGTTSPLRLLSVGTTSGNGEISMLAGTSQVNSILFGDGVTGSDVYRGYVQYDHATDKLLLATAAASRIVIDSSGNVGIGTASPSYQLQLSTDSAGKPGAGGLWTVVSDERIKANIVPADLDRCYEIVKSVPLKHFGFAPGVYIDDQIHDKHNLGWIAQDVQKVFKHAVSVKPFTLKTAIPDGTEDYEEQAFTLETVEDTKVSIEILNGKPVQVSKTTSTENKVLLFDMVEVLDEAGMAVMNGDTPVTHQMPRMVTKTRPKVRHEVIEDCLDLNSGQMIAALYGAVQALMAKVDTLEAKLAAR